MKVDNPDEAIQEFLGMPALEDEKGDWLVAGHNRLEFFLQILTSTLKGALKV